MQMKKKKNYINRINRKYYDNYTTVIKNTNKIIRFRGNVLTKKF